jgi:stage IV sporulation protein FB
VLLQEPGPTRGDLNFSLFGIPVRINPLFWITAILLGVNISDRDLGLLLIWVVAFFISILWHELGHALVILSFGFRPWITLYGMGGLASYDPSKHRRFGGVKSGEQILISFAGPAAELLLAALLVGILYAARLGDHLSFNPPFYIPHVELDNVRLQMFLNFLFFVCVFWALVNLLPIYPLDGGHIARELFLRFNLRDGIRQSLVLSMIAAVSFGVYAAVVWRDFFILMFFGFLAYENYQTYQAYSGRGRW